MQGPRTIRQWIVLIGVVAVLFAGMMCAVDVARLGNGHHRYYWLQHAVSHRQSERSLHKEAESARRAAAKARGPVGSILRDESEGTVEFWTARAEELERLAAEETRDADDALKIHASRGHRLSEAPPWVRESLKADVRNVEP